IMRMVLILAFPAVTVTRGLCTRGTVRAFWMGAFFAALAAFVWQFNHFGPYSASLPPDTYYPRFEALMGQVQISSERESEMIGFVWLSMPIVGLVSALSYRFAFGGKSGCGRPPGA